MVLPLVFCRRCSINFLSASLFVLPAFLVSCAASFVACCRRSWACSPSPSPPSPSPSPPAIAQSWPQYWRPNPAFPNISPANNRHNPISQSFLRIVWFVNCFSKTFPTQMLLQMQLSSVIVTVASAASRPFFVFVLPPASPKLKNIFLVFASIAFGFPCPSHCHGQRVATAVDTTKPTPQMPPTQPCVSSSLSSLPLNVSPPPLVMETGALLMARPRVLPRCQIGPRLLNRAVWGPLRAHLLRLGDMVSVCSFFLIVVVPTAALIAFAVYAGNVATDAAVCACSGVAANVAINEMYPKLFVRLCR